MKPKNCLCGGKAVKGGVFGFGVLEDRCVCTCQFSRCVTGPTKYTIKGAMNAWDRKINALRKLQEEVSCICSECPYKDFCDEYGDNINELCDSDTCEDIAAIYTCIQHLEESIL